MVNAILPDQFVDVGKYVYCARPRGRGDYHEGQLWLDGRETRFASRLDLVGLAELRGGGGHPRAAAPASQAAWSPRTRPSAPAEGEFTRLGGARTGHQVGGKLQPQLGGH